MHEILGGITTVMAVAGVMLNNKLNIGCFYLWIVSNSISAYLHCRVELWSLAARDIVFIFLALDGIRHWNKSRKDENFAV